MRISLVKGGFYIYTSVKKEKVYKNEEIEVLNVKFCSIILAKYLGNLVLKIYSAIICACIHFEIVSYKMYFIFCKNYGWIIHIWYWFFFRFNVQKVKQNLHGAFLNIMTQQVQAYIENGLQVEKKKERSEYLECQISRLLPSGFNPF